MLCLKFLEFVEVDNDGNWISAAGTILFFQLFRIAPAPFMSVNLGSWRVQR